ncbi:716_t:CDS:2 [Cetraspora pellucida]|uniref:716_t:CDS:1 n=1 Tax=Cetraspora pellucida TaxID=1433469 RepID=A0A9N9AW64_9GLOM|nr:716_t:CDS:2 [Cetraspora pellucida]
MNIAKSAHANANQEGIQMSLLLAIKKKKRLDECHFTTCRYQSNYNVSKTGHSSGPIARATKSIKRLEIEKQAKLANLHAQELVNIEKKNY